MFTFQMSVSELESILTRRHILFSRMFASRLISATSVAEMNQIVQLMIEMQSQLATEMTDFE